MYAVRLWFFMSYHSDDFYPGHFEYIQGYNEIAPQAQPCGRHMVRVYSEPRFRGAYRLRTTIARGSAMLSTPRAGWSSKRFFPV